MPSKGPSVHIVSDWNPSGVKAAQRDVGYLDKQVQGFSKSFMAGFAGIGASLGGLVALQSVVSFFKDSAQAAMEDQAAMASLGKTLENVGQGFKQTGVEDFISKMQLATGVADNDLRGAFQRLVTVTGDVEKSQTALKLAMDISAGTGKDLESVSAALAKGYGGQTTALQRLGVGIDAATLKSKDMGAITDALSSKFTGQAAVAANTYQGQMNRLSQAVGEAQETIGYALMDALDRVINKMGGGVGGMQGVIMQTGDTLAAFIDDVAGTAVAIGNLTGKLVELGSFGLVKAKSGLFDLGSWFQAFVDTVLQFLGGPAVGFYKFLVDVGLVSDDAAGSTEDLALANEHGARASMQAAKGINDLGDETAYADKVASGAAKSFLALYEAAALAAGQQRDAANTSATVLAALEEGAKTGGVPGYWDKVREKYGEAADAADKLRSSTGGAGKAAEDLAIKWKATAASITADMDALTISMGGGGQVIAGAMVKSFQDRLAAFKGVVDAQVGIVTQARQALDQYSQSITDTVMGKINFSTVDPTTNEPMSPEQIVQMILGDMTNQQNAVTAIAGIATQLPPALTAQIIALPPDAAVALANYLAANPALVEQLTTNFNALATATQTLLGDPMAIAFAKVGSRSAVAMIADAKKAIADAGDSFQNFVKSKLDTDITVRVHWAADRWDPPTGSSSGRAMGGPVSAGVPVLVGERGMEMFVPSVDGSIIPNHDLSMGGASASGGNTYNINVSTGVGDPRQIGEQVVSYIKRFEAASGPVFARA